MKLREEEDKYHNASVLQINFMKHACQVFRKGQVLTLKYQAA